MGFALTSLIQFGFMEDKYHVLLWLDQPLGDLTEIYSCMGIEVMDSLSPTGTYR